MYRLSAHAVEQINDRQIPIQLLEMVFEQPEQIVEEDGLQVYQSRFYQSGKERLLRLYVNDAVDPALIVTVYVTSKVEKYWRSV